MSIKTPKRLVLGVIASLVFAPFAAVAPASATASTLLPFQVTAASYKSADFAATVSVQQVAGANNFVEFSSGSDTSTDVLAVIKVTGGTITSKTDAATLSTSTLNTAATELVYSTNDVFSGDAVNKFRVGTPSEGTITVVVATRVTSAGVVTDTTRQTFTISVTATATVGVVSVANSTSFLDTKAATSHDATSDATVSAIKTAGTFAGSVKLTLVDGNKVSLDAKTVTAVVTGPGLVGISADASGSASATKGRAVSAATTSGGVLFASIFADGGAGVSIITFSVGTTVVATETVTFYGDVASYTVVVNKAHIGAGEGEQTDVLRVTALDAAGVKIPNETIHASVGTSTTATVQASTTTDATGVAKFAATGVADKFGAVEVTFGNKASAATVTAKGTFGVASVRAASIAITADKTSYLPGELMTLTFTAKDANGLGLPNATYGVNTLISSADANPLISQGLTSTPFKGDATLALKAGVVTATAYAPLVEGPVNFVWTVPGTAGGTATANLAAALLGTKITLAVTVAKPVVPVVVPPVVYDNPTLSFVKSAGRVILSGTAVDGEGDIIIYTKKVGTTAWKERAKTLEVAAPGDFNGSIKAPKSNVLIRVKQEGTGQFSNQIIVLK